MPTECTDAARDRFMTAVATQRQQPQDPGLGGDSAPSGAVSEVYDWDALSGSTIVGHARNGDDGGYMDVEGTATPPDQLESDVPLIADVGQSTAVASALPRPRRVTVSLLQTSEL